MPIWVEKKCYYGEQAKKTKSTWKEFHRSDIRSPPIVTTDFLYVRFIGDRSIDEKDFGKIQKDRVLEMKQWADEVKKVDTGKIRGRRKEVN
jgi:hypothetical protein